MVEIVLAVCFFALAILVISDWIVRKNGKQDKEIEEIKKELEEMKTKNYLQSIECIKRDQAQIDMIEQLIRLHNEETEGK